MKKFTHPVLALLLLLFQSCMTQEGEIDNPCHGIACTLDFRTITVEIKYADGGAVALDNFKVTHIPTGTDLTREVTAQEFQLMRESGIYPLFGDEFTREFRQKEADLNFKGYIDEVEVVSSNHKVGADCCHVFHISGEREIIIQ